MEINALVMDIKKFISSWSNKGNLPLSLDGDTHYDLLQKLGDHVLRSPLRVNAVMAVSHLAKRTHIRNYLKAMLKKEDKYLSPYQILQFLCILHDVSKYFFSFTKAFIYFPFVLIYWILDNVLRSISWSMFWSCKDDSLRQGSHILVILSLLLCLLLTKVFLAARMQLLISLSTS